MLRAHPEYRLAALGGAVILLLAVVVGGWAVASRGGAPNTDTARATPAPAAGSGLGSATPVPTPAPTGTPDPALAAAIQVGEQFTLAYVSYDYRSGPPTGAAVKPYATQRLFWQVTQGGQDTAGNPAPWTAITVGADEVMMATVVGSQGELADGSDAAVQVVVAEHDTTSGGTWSGQRQEDLGLVRTGGRWLVDQVTQVTPQS